MAPYSFIFERRKTMNEQMDYLQRRYDKKCPICGKTFAYYPSEHVYKHSKGRETLYFCSWTCMRKHEKEGLK